MPGSGNNNVNGIESFFKVRPSRANIREGEIVSFLEKGKLVKLEKRKGIVFETSFVEQGKKEEVQIPAKIIEGARIESSGGGNITRVTAGTGLGGGGTSGSLTLSVSAAQTSITSILATDVKIGEDDQTKIDFEAANEIRFYTDNAEAVRIEADQDVHFDQDVIAFSSTPSDIRLKKNFEKIENGLDVVNKLEGHTFNWKKNDKRLSAGFKAQEVEKILPHLIDEKKLPLQTDDDREYKVLRYEEIIPYLVEAIKELKEEIKELKK